MAGSGDCLRAAWWSLAVATAMREAGLGHVAIDGMPVAIISRKDSDAIDRSSTGLVADGDEQQRPRSHEVTPERFAQPSIRQSRFSIQQFLQKDGCLVFQHPARLSSVLRGRAELFSCCRPNGDRDQQRTKSRPPRSAAAAQSLGRAPSAAGARPSESAESDP